MQIYEMKVTSFYGKRKLFKKFHKGIDLRTWDENFENRLDITLPIECIFDYSVYQKKWGWTHIFSPTRGPAQLIKFTHLTNPELLTGQVCSAGMIVGQSTLTDYMKKKKFGEHLHFECWREGHHFDPKLYFNYLRFVHEEEKTIY